MEHFFTSFAFDYLNRNISFAIFFILIILARLALNRFPKRYSYVLWLFLGVKAVFNTGFSLAGVVSKMHRTGTVSETAAAGLIGRAVTTPVQAGTAISGILAETSKSPERSRLFILFFAVWAVGFFLLLFMGVKSYADLKKKVNLSFSGKKDIRICDYIDSPMVFGIFKPAIYVPSGIDTSELEYVIKHEQIHLKRKDPLLKLCAFAILTFYWMNPLAWVAFKLINLDMELSCDEAVLEKEDSEVRESYGKWLVFFAASGKTFGPAPTAFGETDVERRVKNMGKKKNYKVMACITAILVVVAVAAICLFKAPELFAAPAEETKPAHEESNEEKAVAAATDNMQELLNTLETEEAAVIAAMEADTTSIEESISEDPIPAQEDTVWLWPLESDYPITRLFGMGHKLVGGETVEEMHTGVDIAAPIGTPVLAARTGSVEFAGWESKENGNVVIIKVDDHTTVKYAHMDSVSVNTGDSVSQGDNVGTVGSSGASTGPHLCFMVTAYSDFVDPMQFFDAE